MYEHVNITSDNLTHCQTDISGTICICTGGWLHQCTGTGTDGERLWAPLFHVQYLIQYRTQLTASMVKFNIVGTIHLNRTVSIANTRTC